MDWKLYKEEITAIVELIEDKQYPAKRNITDYLCKIFGYPKDMEDFINSEYERITPIENCKEDLTTLLKK